MANKSTTTPSDEGWGAAIIFTLFTWLQGIVFAALKGKETFSRGVLIAAALALGGFVVWVLYHIIARRNRGQVMILLASTGILGFEQEAVLPLSQALTRPALFFLAMVLYWGTISLLMRKLQMKRTRHSTFVLWDKEIDQRNTH